MKTNFTSMNSFRVGTEKFGQIPVLTLGLLAGVTAVQASTDYAPAIWRSAYANHWYTSGYGHRFMVEHDMEGYYASTISYIQRSTTSVSVTFCVNGKKDTSTDYAAGEITQMVREAYYSWQARCWNKYAHGTEHEGFVSNPAWFTEALYQTSGLATRHICDKYSLPKDRNHVIGHDQKRISAWKTWMTSQGYSTAFQTCNTHTDPGAYWNWTHFMDIVKGTVSIPSAPSSLVLTVVSSSQINLKWTDTSAIETGFKVERATALAGPFTQIGTTAANVVTYSSTGLAVNTTYYYRVRSYNASGNSGYSNTPNAKTLDAPPAAPSALTATAVSDTQINLAWTDGSSNETGFKVERSSDNVTFAEIVAVGVNVVSYSNTGLLGNTLYYYRVRAYNALGNSAYTAVASDMTAPPAPSGLTATAMAYNQIDLSWTDNSSSEAGFKIERGTASGGPFTQISSTTADVPTYSDTGVVKSTTYWYRVRSYNANGNSSYSALASVTTPVQPPFLTPIPNQTIAASNLLAFSVTSTDPNKVVTTNTWQTFESFANNTQDGKILFNRPISSSSTSAFLDTSTNYTRVLTGGQLTPASKALKAGWGFKTGFNTVWLRLTTLNCATNPNPTIPLDQTVQFEFFPAHTVNVGIGVRESGAVGADGTDGGTNGTIEWVGVGSIDGTGVPIPTNNVAIGTQKTMSFNIPFCAQTAFTGDGIVDESGAKGVLDSIIIQATSAGAAGANYAWFDNLRVVNDNTLAYSLDSAPSGMTIGRRTGLIKWTPAGSQGGNWTVAVRVTDQLGAQDVKTFRVTVVSGNSPPVLSAIGNKTVNEASLLTFTARATDYDSSLVSWWAAENDATDVNQVNDGTLVNTGYTPGTGSAFKFDGVDDYVQTSSSTSLKMTNTMTFGCWTYPTSTVTGMLANKEGEYEFFRGSDGTISFAFANTTPGWVSVSSGYQLPTNRWTHVAVTYASGVVKTYANGVLVNTYNGTGPIGDVDATKNDFRIGGRQSGANYFGGLIDQPSLYNRELTATEVQTLSNPNLAYPQTGLISRWEAENNATDVKNLNNGTMTGGATFAAATKLGRSFAFDGSTNTYVQIGAQPSLVMASVMSFESWIYPTGPGSGANGGGGILICKEGEYEISRYADGTIRYAFANTNPGWTWTNTTLVAPLYTWTHVAMTYSNGIMKTYSNGVLVNTINGAGAIGDNDATKNDFRIGGRQGAIQNFQGFIDEPSLYKRVLTATEVTALYNGQTKGFGTFSLDAGYPTGASINATTGAFTWTPTEAQGPGSYPITIRVTDNGSPSSNDFETITVTVNELNVAPVLATISNQTVNEGSALNLTAVATDADLPANTITYSLDPGAPAGMTIGSSDGVISWTPTEAQGPGTYAVTVRAKDNGSPVLSNTRSFTVTVNEVNTTPTIFVNTASITTATNFADFEVFDEGEASGNVMFRLPNYSGTTASYIDTAVTNDTVIETAFPSGNISGKVLRMSASFKTGTTNPYLHMTTASSSSDTYILPNPTIDFGGKLRFDIYSSKSISLCIAVRESGTSAPIGGDGGSSSTWQSEYVGATGTNSNGRPICTRTITASNWTTVEFDMPHEPVVSSQGEGNGVLATGKGPLKNVVIVPTGGMGLYDIYLDNFTVLTTITNTGNIVVDPVTTVEFTATGIDADIPAQTLTYSLDTAPVGAEIDPDTGVFTWTPDYTQWGTNGVTIRVTDNGAGNLTSTTNLNIVVNHLNSPPRLGAFFEAGQALEVNSGDTINMTIEAQDDDTNNLTYTMVGTPPSGATLDPVTGVFNWTPTGGLSTNTITIRVTDDGIPPLYSDGDLVIIVTPTNAKPVLLLSAATVTEELINYESITDMTNEHVMFNKAGNSGTTTAFIDTTATQTSYVTNSFPAGGTNAHGSKVMKFIWSFKTGTTNPWLRMNTYLTGSPSYLPNPTIEMQQTLQFDIYTTKSLKVAVGARETGTTAAIGANGHVANTPIEWVGVTNVVNGSPFPSRVVNVSNWTTLQFNFATDSIGAFTGDGVMASGRGTLEHLAFVPNGGMGAYTVYVDNFKQIYTYASGSTVTMNTGAKLALTASATDADTPAQPLSFALDADAPTNSVINDTNGLFSWTPGTSDAGTSNAIAFFVEDAPATGAPSKSDTKTLTVIVNADPLSVQSAALEATTVGSGETVSLAWDAVIGATYTIQFKTGLADSGWTDYATVTAESTTASIVVANDDDRFYRVLRTDGSVISDQ